MRKLTQIIQAIRAALLHRNEPCALVAWALQDLEGFPRMFKASQANDSVVRLVPVHGAISDLQFSVIVLDLDADTLTMRDQQGVLVHLRNFERTLLWHAYFKWASQTGFRLTVERGGDLLREPWHV